MWATLTRLDWLQSPKGDGIHEAVRRPILVRRKATRTTIYLPIVKSPYSRFKILTSIYFQAIRSLRAVVIVAVVAVVGVAVVVWSQYISSAQSPHVPSPGFY